MEPSSKFSVTISDYKGFKAVSSIETAALSAGNFAAQAALRATFSSALMGMSLGRHLRDQFSWVDDMGIGPQTGVGAHKAIIGQKWQVKYVDANGERFAMTIPCADASLCNPDERYKAGDGEDGYVDAFIAAFQAFAVSPRDASAVTVDEILYVGRGRRKPGV